MVTRPPPDGSARRRCGECTLCCTVMGVRGPELHKLPGERCGHVCSAGCRIYAGRPAECREFVCVWAQGGLPKPYRPDKVGVCFTSDGERLIGFTDPARPSRWRAIAPFLEGIGRRGAIVLIGPPGGKPQVMFCEDGELQRPPEADEEPGDD